MTVKELLTLARQLELRVGRLYEHMARDFAFDPALVGLLQTLANQEQEHAAIVESALAKLDLPEQRISFDTTLFTHFIDAVDDIEDEVCSDGVTADAAREIIQHLESSMAERFYARIPDQTPGIDPAFVKRMAQTSRQHLKLVQSFAEHHPPASEETEG